MGNRFARVALLLALALAAQGCGPERSTGGKDAAAARRAPVSGDWFILPIDSDPVTLNFVSGRDEYQALVARFVADSLVDEGTELEPVPRLASSWEFSPDGKVLTFHLRRGVQWHDGAPFSARDVLFTYRKMLDPASRARADLLQDVLDVSVPDDGTLRVTFREATVLALDAWKFPVLPEHRFRGEDFMTSRAHQSPIGTGPFRFVRWSRGREIVLVANDDYFLGRPHLDRIVLKIIPAPSTQLQSLLTGETDWSSLPPDEWHARKESAEFRRRFQIFEYPPLFLYYVAWNGKTGFFSDPRVRMAMSLSLDRAGFLQKAYKGAGVLATSSFHPKQFGYDSTLIPPPFDPERAGALLDAAGWKRDPGDGMRRRNGEIFRFSLLIFQGSPVQEQLAALLQEGLQRSGVRVDIRILDFPALLERLRTRHYEAAISGWKLTSDPDPTPFFHSDPALGTSNYFGYADAEMDRLLLEGRHALNREERRKVYRRVQAILLRDQPCSFLFFPVSRVALDGRFRGARPSAAASPLRSFPGILEWYVPSKLQKHRGPS